MTLLEDLGLQDPTSRTVATIEHASSQGEVRLKHMRTTSHTSKFLHNTVSLVRLAK